MIACINQVETSLDQGAPITTILLELIEFHIHNVPAETKGFMAGITRRISEGQLTHEIVSAWISMISHELQNPRYMSKYTTTAWKAETIVDQLKVSN